MPEVRLVRHVQHTPEDLLELVSDVEDYPTFINLISALRVTSRETISDAHERFHAEATVAYKFVRENFACVVDLDKAANSISVKKADRSGAVKSLKNSWKFHELSDGSTIVDFFVEVKLKAFPLEIMLRDKFDEAGQKIMAVFLKRAKQRFKLINTPDMMVETEMRDLGLDHRLLQY